MNRFNYLGVRRYRRSALSFALDNRIRGPFGALTAILVITCVCTDVQLSRLQAAQRAYRAADARLAAGRYTLEHARATQAKLADNSAQEAYVAELRRQSRLHGNALAWIGNHLPRNTWLRAIRYEAGRYTLEGTAPGMTAVGTAILALRDVDRGTVSQLVSAANDERSGPTPVQFSLRLENAR